MVVSSAMFPRRPAITFVALRWIAKLQLQRGIELP
jgi:hypothetical protein